MRLWTLATLCTASLLILSGCGAKAPVPKKDAVVDSTLPIVTLTKNGTIVDTNTIALEWAAIDDQRVEGVYIYRVELDAQAKGESKRDRGVKSDYYDTVNSRFSTHYLDEKVEPATRYGYYFKSYSANAESQKSEMTTITSLPQMESVVWIHSRQSMPRSAKIIWRPHENQKVKAYIVQRRTLQEERWSDIATVDGRLNAEFIDKNLKDNFTYIYRIRALTYDGIISKASQEVTVITKELPPEITQVVASTDLPKKIEINWKGSDIVDFLTYRVYRSTSINGSYEAIIDTKNNSYTDVIKEDGKEYFYRVSTIDRDKLESINSNHTALGRTLVKPATPSLMDAKQLNGTVKLSWVTTDSRAVSYIVQKRYSKSFLESSIEDFQNIKNNEFTDSEIEDGRTYFYKIFAVDANGIKSEPSIEITIKVNDKSAVKKPNSTVRKAPSNNVEKKFEQNNSVESNIAPAEDIVIPMQDF